MKRLLIFLAVLFLADSSYGQLQQACWVYPYSETTCDPSVTKTLQVNAKVNTPGTGYHNWWRTRSYLSSGGYAYVTPRVIVGTSTSDYWLLQNHSYTISTSGTYTATVDVQWSDDFGANWITAYSFNGGGYPSTPCAYPLNVNLQKSNANFSFFVNGRTISPNGSDPVEVIRCNGEDVALDAIVGTGAFTHVETQLESGLYEPGTGFTPFAHLVSGYHPIEATVGTSFIDPSTPFFPFWIHDPWVTTRYIRVTVKVYGPCDPPPGYTTKTIIFKVVDVAALVDFMMQGPLDEFGNGCTSWQNRNTSGIFASFPQPVSAPPCYDGWLGPLSVNVQSAYPHMSPGALYSGYQYLVERVSPSPAVLGTASGPGTLPVTQNLNTVTGGYFVSNYYSIKNNEVFKVTATVYTNDCGPISAYSFFKIIDGGAPGEWWRKAPEQAAETEHVLVFPNPATGAIHFAWSSKQTGNGSVSIVLKDVFGKTAFQQAIAKHEGMNDQVLDISSLPAGMYFYTIHTESGEHSGKLLKQ